MYDARREAHEFVGNDRDQAVADACRFFGVDESELTLAVLGEGQVSGLASRTVVVAVPTELKGRSGSRSDRSDSDSPRDREPREARGRRRGREGDRDRDRDGDSGRGRGRGRRGGEEREPRRAAADKPSGPAKGEIDGELDEIGQFVLGVVERMKLGSFQISQTLDGDILVITLRGEAAERLNQAETRVGDALQLLTNQAAMRGGTEGPRVVIDIEGERERRDEFLEQLAERAADRAVKSGRSVALDPMNGKDRRIIHMALREEEGIATMSMGEGRYRQVVVVPEGAPEYEEAERLSGEAARDDD